MKSVAVFLGSKRLGLQVLKALHPVGQQFSWRVIHPEDSDDPRSALGEFKSWALAHRVELETVWSAQEASRALRGGEVSYAFVCGWYWKIPSADLGVARHGFWGLHNSLLPQYRGGSPLVWALLRGERRVGATVFRLTEELDAGPILLQVATDVLSTDDIGTVLHRITNEVVRELPHSWLRLLHGKATLREQVGTVGEVFRMRVEEDGLIRFDSNGEDLVRFIRAQTRPYPGAFFEFEGDRFRVWSADRVQDRIRKPPGLVVRAAHGELDVVATDQSLIRLSQIWRGPALPHASAYVPDLGPMANRNLRDAHGPP